MLPNGNPILAALLAAYCAKASPVNTRPHQVQAVIDAPKTQLEADRITGASFVVNGILNDEVVVKLERQIQLSEPARLLMLVLKLRRGSLTTERGISIDAIARNTVEYLNAKCAIQKPDQEVSSNETVVLDAATIKQVVDHDVQYWGGTCPGCVIL